MIRSILLLLVLWSFVHVGIIAFRQLSKKEKWSVVKTVMFSFGTAFITGIIVAVFVAIF